jgi:hypothetical protein
MKSGEVYPSKYLKAEELDDELTVTITKVVMEELESKDRGKHDKPVAYFKEVEKGLVINKTNWSIIARIHGDESDDWIGKQITLFVMDVEAFGEMVNAIRVKPPRKVAPKMAGVNKGSEVEQDGELITRYWVTVKSFGLDKKRGLQILKENGGDFGNALMFLEGDDQVPM